MCICFCVFVYELFRGFIFIWAIISIKMPITNNKLKNRSFERLYNLVSIEKNSNNYFFDSLWMVIDIWESKNESENIMGKYTTLDICWDIWYLLAD